MRISRSTLGLVALFALAASAAVPKSMGASPPDAVSVPKQFDPPAFAPSLSQVVTVDLAQMPSFDVVMPAFLVMRVVKVDSSGHELLKIAVARVNVPNPARRSTTDRATLRAAARSSSFISGNAIVAAHYATGNRLRYRRSALRDFLPARRLRLSS